MSDDDKVVTLPTAKRPKPDAALEVVHSYKCQHGHFLVDEKAAEVECGLCHEKLNPMWVLGRIAHDDWRLRERWASMKAEVDLLAPKLRAKCKHCGKMTPVHSSASVSDLQRRAAEIARGSE